jgi:pilus assembly protein Flp/PilA
MKLVQKFLNDESGATAIEYGLIAALISVAIIAGASTLGTQVGATFTGIGGEVNTANQQLPNGG